MTLGIRSLGRVGNERSVVSWPYISMLSTVVAVPLDLPLPLLHQNILLSEKEIGFVVISSTYHSNSEFNFYWHLKSGWLIFYLSVLNALEFLYDAIKMYTLLIKSHQTFTYNLPCKFF